MIRTDLAFESAREWEGELKGVKISVEDKGAFKIERVEITEQEAALKLEKPCGNYVTLSLPTLSLLSDADNEAAKILSDELKRIIPFDAKSFFVVGLGNREITLDSIGPKSANKILATRHIGKELRKSLNLTSLRDVSAIATGVLGKTGIETEETISGISDRIKPDCIIVIDSFAAADKGRICKSVQISNSGINPGSGVGNCRKEISQRTMKRPVIAIGVPTVSDLGEGIIITHRDIDVCTDKAASIISNALNLLMQPSLDLETIIGLI